MNKKNIFQLIVVAMLLITSFASTGGALAWSSCASTITVQWGDTLSGIAALCGTTVDAIRAENPGLGWWVYAGQVLCIPTGYSTPVSYPTYGGTYVVQWGDTLGKIAARAGIRLGDLLAVNAQIWNPSLIYPGQVINLPAGVSAPPPVYNPPPQDDPDYPPVYTGSTLKITYKNGLIVRNGPGGDIVGWATYDKYMLWQYNASTITEDKYGKVWVQVTLDPPQHGYTSGWILVRDHLGNFFTDPQIDD